MRKQSTRGLRRRQRTGKDRPGAERVRHAGPVSPLAGSAGRRRWPGASALLQVCPRTRSRTGARSGVRHASSSLLHTGSLLVTLAGYLN